MDFLPYAFVALAVLILFRLVLGPRRATGPSPKAEPSIAARNAARQRIVAEAERLCSLEDELERLAEGTGQGMSDVSARDRAEQVRAEALRLRAELEADCARYVLPIRLALGRRRRSPSFPPARRSAS